MGMKAIWAVDYDFREDKCYDRPSCPECKAPIGLDEDGKYHCFSCGEIVEVDDPKMIEWFAIRDESKTENEDCFLGCSGKGTMEVHYMRNPITLEWQTMGGECKKCGMRFIV